ncbi:MAG TPA: hypothetical protein VHF86_00200, partial [Xanthomonadaceae bacterium]|nr:hypothetical protein [Xanthomonadaceae bacterium]
MASDRPSTARRGLLKAAAGAAVAALPWPCVAAQPTSADPGVYSARARALVERALVIDMLAPLKLDFRPEAYAGRISAQDAAMFRDSGITGFHNSVGFYGEKAYEDVLAFLAAW